MGSIFYLSLHFHENKMCAMYIKILEANTGSFIVKKKDKLRFNVTALPNNASAEYKFRAKSLNGVNHDWIIKNQNGKTKEILITLRKLDLLKNDPIIGRVRINVEDLPANQISHMCVDMTHNNERVDCGQIRLMIHNCMDNARPFAAPSISNWRA